MLNSIFRSLRQLPRRRFSNVQVNYTYDESNTTSHVFNFTPESEVEIKRILNKYPKNYKKSAVISVLFIAQKQNSNFLSLSAMKKVAEVLEIPEIDVYEVASFYTMFNRTRVGKFHLQICGTTPCMVAGCEPVIEVMILTISKRSISDIIVS
jgi:NADH dehydrogenase (ubiquinone) flavoprotein 2